VTILTHILLIALLAYAGICVLYFFFQEKVIFVPTWPHDAFEPSLSTPTSQLFLHTRHKGYIHAIHLHVDKPRGLVFYLHGNTGSLRRWQFMAEEISAHGFDVVAMDYRGYGLSKGRRRESWMHRDAEILFDRVADRYPGLPVIIYGRSLGSGFATRLASRRQADGLILETPFNKLEDVARHYLPFIPVRSLLRYHFRSDRHLRDVQCPVMIFHGTRDIVVPYAFALKLFRSAREGQSVRMVTIVGGKHSNLNRFPLFHERLGGFLNEIARNG
jgi:uncharacterized protein